ncbi:hypothetical protein HDU93_009195 [Gonapodya sp. JEL0774]|nr:hypothetical protein HDU93_009195 [Gonapodya sp. JEL0774]
MFATSPSPLLSLRILIIGAGPAGLALARILQLKGATNVVVIERDPHRHHRPQGGSLDLHNESGQWALRMAGLHAEFMKLARPEGEDLKVTDKHLNVVYSDVGSGGPSPIFGTMFLRPEIDRTQLRDLLIDSLAPGTIRWGTEVAEITEDPVGGPYAVRLKTVTDGVAKARDGPNMESNVHDSQLLQADLIVGADGAWSRTRSHLTQVKPEYSGISFYDITIDNADSIPLPGSPDFPTAGALAGRGMVIALEQHRGFFIQRNSGGSVRIYASLAVPEDFLDAPENSLAGASDIKAVNAHIASLFPNWSPVLLSLITANTNPVTPRKIFALPVGHSWSRPTPTPGSPPRAAMITLVGDAAHLMSPFAGEGVNQALADSASLAEVLASLRHSSSLELAVTEYERAMFARVEPLAKESKDNLALFLLTEDTPMGLVKQMKEYMSWGFFIKFAAGKVLEKVMGRSKS